MPVCVVVISWDVREDKPLDRKKQRGQRRKLKAMFQSIDHFVPFSHTERTYEHFHVPGGPFIESCQTSGKVKTAFCRKWLETTEKFIAQKPAEIAFCKIAAVLSVPDYWSSQIIIFYDKSYYDSFWDRTGPEQIWKLTQGKGSFCKERNIITSLREICCHEILTEGNQVIKYDLWFYGDVPME